MINSYDNPNMQTGEQLFNSIFGEDSREYTENGSGFEEVTEELGECTLGETEPQKSVGEVFVGLFTLEDTEDEEEQLCPVAKEALKLAEKLDAAEQIIESQGESIVMLVNALREATFRAELAETVLNVLL